MRGRRRHIALSASIAVSLLLHDPPRVEACGCLSPPAVTEGEYAVNQSAEQIIFEADEAGWITAHVLIKYAGDPAQFAWIIPAPEAPELAISPASAFGLLDNITKPDVAVEVEDLCPISGWQCRYHQGARCGFGAGSIDEDSPTSADAGVDPGGGSGVDIINEQVVGDYQTITFRASEAAAAVQWLRDNGFLVNATTSIYMESYIQANMVFVAAKLVPGASTDAIKPLRMKYRAPYPMIPLVLTAIAAQPHMTVSAYVYGATPYRPLGHPVVTIDPDRIAQDRNLRGNYPMVLARTIDDAGGDAFAIEYLASSPVPAFGQGGSGCCDGGIDFCSIGGDGQCQCPRDEFDAGDCSQVGDIVEGVRLLDELAARHTTLTRITTRISPEEMTFDPQFEPDHDASLGGRMFVRGRQVTLGACRDAVIDQPAFETIEHTADCSSLYCGRGSCVTNTLGAPGCACEAGFVAQQFNDLDGKPSVTCVPQTPPCDFKAGGEPLPDACANVNCGTGTCIDRNGIAVCACAPGSGAFAGIAATPRCAPFALDSGTPGAQDYSEPLRALEVCAPPPPACGEDGWLVEVASPRPGVDCGNTKPHFLAMLPGPAPTCGPFGCGGCQESSELPPFAIVGMFGVSVFLLRRRRRLAR